MKAPSAQKSIYAGLMLVLLLLLMLAIDVNPIEFSKNAFFQVKSPKIILEVPGLLARASDDTYYHYHEDILKKISPEGITIWSIKPQGDLLWMGPEGILFSEERSIKMIDENGNAAFKIQNFLESPRVLDMKNQYMLFSGKMIDRECAVLLNDKGQIAWQFPVEGDLISGSVHEKGIYTVVNIIDNNAKSKIMVISPKGAVLSERADWDLVLQTAVTEDGIYVLTADRALMMNFQGELFWEYKLPGKILRSDISEDGSITAIVKNQLGHLTQDQLLKLVILSPDGNLMENFSLEKIPESIHKSSKYLYIVENRGFSILSQEGVLLSDIRLAGIKKLDISDESHIIAILEEKSSLLTIPSGGN